MGKTDANMGQLAVLAQRTAGRAARRPGGAPHVTQCHRLRSDPQPDPFTPRPQEPSLWPLPFSCRSSKQEQAELQYLGGSPQRRPGRVAPKGGSGQKPAIEYGGRHF